MTPQEINPKFTMEKVSADLALNEVVESYFDRLSHRYSKLGSMAAKVQNLDHLLETLALVRKEKEEKEAKELGLLPKAEKGATPKPSRLLFYTPAFSLVEILHSEFDLATHLVELKKEKGYEYTPAELINSLDRYVRDFAGHADFSNGDSKRPPELPKKPSFWKHPIKHIFSHSPKKSRAYSSASKPTSNTFSQTCCIDNILMILMEFINADRLLTATFANPFEQTSSEIIETELASEKSFSQGLIIHTGSGFSHPKPQLREVVIDQLRNSYGSEILSLRHEASHSDLAAGELLIDSSVNTMLDYCRTLPGTEEINLETFTEDYFNLFFPGASDLANLHPDDVSRTSGKRLVPIPKERVKKYFKRQETNLQSKLNLVNLERGLRANKLLNEERDFMCLTAGYEEQLALPPPQSNYALVVRSSVKSFGFSKENMDRLLGNLEKYSQMKNLENEINKLMQKGGAILSDEEKTSLDNAKAAQRDKLLELGYNQVRSLEDELGKLTQKAAVLSDKEKPSLDSVKAAQRNKLLELSLALTDIETYNHFTYLKTVRLLERNTHDELYGSVNSLVNWASENLKTRYKEIFLELGIHLRKSGQVGSWFKDLLIERQHKIFEILHKRYPEGSKSVRDEKDLARYQSLYRMDTGYSCLTKGLMVSIKE